VILLNISEIYWVYSYMVVTVDEVCVGTGYLSPRPRTSSLCLKDTKIACVLVLLGRHEHSARPRSIIKTHAQQPMWVLGKMSSVVKELTCVLEQCVIRVWFRLFPVLEISIIYIWWLNVKYYCSWKLSSISSSGSDSTGLTGSASSSASIHQL